MQEELDKLVGKTIEKIYIGKDIVDYNDLVIETSDGDKVRLYQNVHEEWGIDSQ